jgi:hypothetical protein
MVFLAKMPILLYGTVVKHSLKLHAKSKILYSVSYSGPVNISPSYIA